MGAEYEDLGGEGCPHLLLIWMVATVYSVCKNAAEKLVCTLMYVLYFTNTLRQRAQILSFT